MTSIRASTSTIPSGRRSLQPLIDAFGGQAGWTAVALMCVAYIACITPLTSFPMQDYANHVARAAVMADILLHHGSHFGRFFEVHPAAVPNVLPDLILLCTVNAFGAAVGAGIFTALVLLALPGALLFYAHVINLPWRARPFLLLTGLYLSTDWFFLQGFFAFRLALPLFVTSLAVAEMLRRRWSVSGLIAHITVLVLGALTHLSALVFMVAALGVSALVRLWLKTTTVRREAWLLAPAGLLFAAYFGLHARLHESLSSWDYKAAPAFKKLLGTKIRNLLDEFTSFDWHLTVPTLALFGACLILPVLRELSLPRFRTPAVIELLVLALTFLGIYCALPSQNVDASYVDVRALPVITLLLLFVCLQLPSEASAGTIFSRPWVVGLVTVLTIVNLVYVMLPLSSSNAWVDRYRAVARFIPAGSYVLPVHTQPKQPHLLHTGSLVVLDRGAVIPYLFSRDNGAPMTYFSYRHFPYAPDQQWYKAAPDTKAAAVDWNRVACEYDFLLVTMPYDADRIRLPTVTVASNEAAALLAVDKRPCGPAPP